MYITTLHIIGKGINTRFCPTR